MRPVTSRRPTGPRTPWPSLVSRSREPSPPAHRVRHRSPAAAARSIQHYGAAQHGVHDHSTVPAFFGPHRDDTSSLLTSQHTVESRTPTTVSGLNLSVDSAGARVQPVRAGCT